MAADALIVAHPEYQARAATPGERQTNCRALFAAALDPEMIAQLRACAQTGTPCGNDRFREVERVLGRAVGFSRRGRPRRTDEDEGPSAKGQIPLPGF
jgi:putative transposase